MPLNSPAILPSADEKCQYERINSNDSFSELPSRPIQRRSRARHSLDLAAKTLTIASALYGAGCLLHLAYLATYSALHPLPRFAPSLNPSCSCGGTTVAEAKSRGCIFTPLAISWLPPHCIDQDLADAFDAAGPGPDGAWTYYADQNATVEMTREQVGDLANDDKAVFYASHEWHISHCIFTWQKQYRAKWTGTTIERRSNGLDHVRHCEMVFRARDGLQDVVTMAGIALDADDPGETGDGKAIGLGDDY